MRFSLSNAPAACYNALIAAQTPKSKTPDNKTTAGEACTMNGVEMLCIAVRNDYRNSDVFSKVCTFFDSLYAGSRLGVPLSGLLIVGY